jgi:sugar/nucleoside kinase (ribokinase family)
VRARGTVTGEAQVTPDVVVIGAAARDVSADVPTGWRLGGGVAYGALLLARLGLRVSAVVGLDPVARAAGEPTALLAAGVHVWPVLLARGPVFENREDAAGRVQLCVSPSDPIPVDALPAECRDAGAYLLAPVAGELGDDWAAALPASSPVALAWQGMLRELAPGERTRARAPRVTALPRRADVVGVSREDLVAGAGPGVPLDGLVAPGQGLALTAGRSGGIWLHRTRTGRLAGRRWRAVPARVEVDPVGAGDVFLAMLLAGMVPRGGQDARARADGGEIPFVGLFDAGGAGRWLHGAAVAASLAVEGRGLGSVPDLAAIRARIAE